MRDAGDGAGDDQADAGAKTFEREQEISLANNSREMLDQSEHALERIDNGTYGICESCGNPIGKLRLQAAPSCDPMHDMQDRSRSAADPPRADASPTRPSRPRPRTGRRRAACCRLLIGRSGRRAYVADQVTKAWALAPPDRRSSPSTSSATLLRLNLIRNPGAAFSIGTGDTWVLTLVAVRRARGHRRARPGASAAAAGRGPSACCSAGRWATSPTGCSASRAPAGGTSWTSSTTSACSSATSPTSPSSSRGRADRAAGPARHRRRRSGPADGRPSTAADEAQHD